MGQQPSCLIQDSHPHKQKSISYQPEHEAMNSPRAKFTSHSISPTTSQSPSISFNANYSPSASITLNTPFSSRASSPFKSSLSIDASDESSTATTSAATSISLFSWLKFKTDSLPVFLSETPKGSLAAQYPHFCPICYRYFQSIFSTSCCGHNCCNDCGSQYINSKRPGMKLVSNIELPLPCPNCNQTEGVAFVALTQADGSKVYAESPRTQALLEQVKSRQSQTISSEPRKFFA